MHLLARPRPRRASLEGVRKEPQGWLPVLSRRPSSVISAHLEKETLNMFPRQPGEELPQEGKMKVSDMAGAQLMLCSHSFFSLYSLKPHTFLRTN